MNLNDRAPGQPTQRQIETLRAVHDHVVERGFAPSLREIGKAMGIRSTNGVNDHLRALERKGLIVCAPHAARSLAVTEWGLTVLGAARARPPKGAVAPSQPRRGPSWLHGLVYFIEAVGCGRIKIGFTKGDPEERLRSLQTGSPFPLRVVATMRGSAEEEAKLHHRFGDLRVAPNVEWFKPGPPLLDFISTLVSARGPHGLFFELKSRHPFRSVKSRDCTPLPCGTGVRT